MDAYTVGFARLFRVLLSSMAALCPSAVCHANSVCWAVPGLVSSWRAEGNPLDETGANPGSLIGNTSYTAAKVGQGFALDGSGDAVSVANSPSLQLQDFSVEAWIMRANMSLASRDPYLSGVILMGGWDSYGFALHDDGRLILTKVGLGGVFSTQRVSDTNFHHVAVTKTGGLVTFYVDGHGETALNYSPGFQFNGPFAVGARGGDFAPSFWGTLDEVSVYNRALSSSEIEAIYASNGAGKCTGLPFILQQPVDQTAYVGSEAVFSVVATGPVPLRFQWTFNGGAIEGASDQTLTLAKVQLAAAGLYAVTISTPTGSITSSNATLTVKPLPGCASAPEGMISWWRGEANTADQTGANPGTLAGNASFAAGEAGQGFALNGLGDAVSVPNSAALQLQNFSIEAWIKRADTSLACRDGVLAGGIFLGSWASYGFALRDDGELTLGKLGFSGVNSVATVIDTKFHHVAVTKLGAVVTFYIDGRGEVAPAYDPGFQFNGPFALGARGGDFVGSFWGTIDEVAVYSRILSSDEIQGIYQAGPAGKCIQVYPPAFLRGPQSQTAVRGSDAMLFAEATGTMPLFYQWTFNGTNIPAATNSSLTLTNVQMAQSGAYAVVASNAAGSVISSNGVLTVNFPPAAIKLLSAAELEADAITVVVAMDANGNENALSFSLNFPSNLLALADVSLGKDAAGAALLANINRAVNGSLGLALSLPADSTFSEGTRELMQIRFTAALSANPVTPLLGFGDSPTVRQLSDPLAHVLEATYLAARITIKASGLEGDVSPTPSGDSAVTVADWVQVGRYVAGLDQPSDPGLFQRADTAPRTTLGDGVLTVSDWVQVGRYTAGLDSLTFAGGPSAAMGPAALMHLHPQLLSANSAARNVALSSSQIATHEPVPLTVSLEALGTENAVSFSLWFDPSQVRFNAASLGRDAAAALLNLNVSQALLGRIACVLALPPGKSFPAGHDELVTLQFEPNATAAGVVPLTLADQPVGREISDTSASPLPTQYVNGSVTIGSAISLKAAREQQHLRLLWPLSARPMVLQWASDPAGSWTNKLGSSTILNGQNIVTIPATGSREFFRLRSE